MALRDFLPNVFSSRFWVNSVAHRVLRQFLRSLRLS